MAKGEYEFPILVTCLLILALQIHNPFQAKGGCSCKCDGKVQTGSDGASPVQASSLASDGGSAFRAASGQPQQQQYQAPPMEPSSPTSYRRPREPEPQASTSAKPGGLSTDALLRELDSIQAKAKEQQDTLAAAGRMPPASPILQYLKEEDEAAGVSVGRGAPARPIGGQGPAITPQISPQAQGAWPGAAGGAGMGAGTAVATSGQVDAMLRTRRDFGRFLEARQPRGLGVVLGVGRGDFALRLLADWNSAQGVYLVDPFIHIWRGYDDPANLPDTEQQRVFEELRGNLQRFEGKYVMVRDFSHSFAETYKSGGVATGAPTFVYIDANHAEQAVTRDLELWWPLLQSGGILAGSTYMDDVDGRVRVRQAVDKFVAMHRLQLFLTSDDSPPSWFVSKP
eukprot:TRINITY_DN30926_c0_g1_i1.p1 TRINITY_DN30926_c0_g1~~TRINITY_DN30926_c0_g1_i1.p1  ORF type:complete len:417 (+),score=54.45 TRINITY_DN30926_c0_g1_i1:63-1253(+)